MREILFKAKRIDNGEWVVGYYCEGTCNSNCGISLIITELNVENPYRNVLVSATDIEGIRDFDIYEVDEDTICQYTGLIDKNGNKIYENDIVRCKDLVEKRKFKGVVKYDNCSFYIANSFLSNYRWMDYEVEVIGNIFDNPELLENADKEASQQAHQEVMMPAT